MNSKEIRKTFLNYFEGKGHTIVPSAPMVNKDDPTLMFTNAGMNQFKDIFLGNQDAVATRVADTQKCLRVSGKHNDLEEVGRDSYHHTMFEMLGNWSFGDYFKKEAIEWAWDLLTNVYGLSKDRMYVTVFAGDKNDGLEPDIEAEDIWKKYIDPDRILRFDKKDNFWEMGETGPCGPCSEIHIDLRSESERQKIDGGKLVNHDHPQVVEIWNLVFIQFNRKDTGQLVNLPSKHVDTGMGFERLVMAMQEKQSNYDTDIFSRFIQQIESDSGIKYSGKYEDGAYTDIAMRVLADHVRATSFAIADGCLPSNTGAGYVIRRIIRRAVRYYYSYLNIKHPYLHSLVSIAAEYYSEIFPELNAQNGFIKTILEEEEKTFLRTLEKGLDRLEKFDGTNNEIPGDFAFELYDTYGFPFDLTQLIAGERNWKVDEKGFNEALEKQKQRSRSDAKKTVGDWVDIHNGSTEFHGYDELIVEDARILKYRSVKQKDVDIFHLVLDKTPFYAEGGGQIGDTGVLVNSEETIHVLDTIRENELIVHQVNKLPENPKSSFKANVNSERRQKIQRNHSATHLVHAALRERLGEHVQQKGSLVAPDYLRFDFSHFEKLSQEDISEIENRVNQKILENIGLEENREIPIDEAREAGAMMLFGEKYGDTVRMITFGSNYSRELCGGCHVQSTGTIGLFKITSESGVAAGIRRIEAVTGTGAIEYVNDKIVTLEEINQRIKQQDLVKGVDMLLAENKKLQKSIEALQAKLSANSKNEIMQNVRKMDGFQALFQRVENVDSKVLKDMIFQIERDISPAVIGLASVKDNKPTIMLSITKSLVEQKDWHAGNLVREAAKHIKGGGGGQPFFASAGGSDASGLDDALEFLKSKF